MTEQQQTTPRKRAPVIAIDGPAGAGKSTVARLLAERLGLPYLDTGAMYRAAGLLASRAGLTSPFVDGAGRAIAKLVDGHRIKVSTGGGPQQVCIDDQDVSQAIRTPEASNMASAISTLSEVRQALVRLQRQLGEAAGGVMEGRDIGSIVFPDADLKLFLTASPDERARRRHQQLVESGAEITIEEVSEQQRQRDLQDTTRSDSPLMVAPGSVVLDTTGMALDEIISTILNRLNNRERDNA